MDGQVVETEETDCNIEGFLRSVHPAFFNQSRWSLLFVTLNVILGRHILFPLILAMFDSMVQTLRKTCLRLPLTQRSLSLDENLRAKESGKEKTSKTSLLLSSFTFPWSLALRHQSLAVRPSFCAKNDAPKEEAVCATWFRETAHLPHPCNHFFSHSLL